MDRDTATLLDIAKAARLVVEFTQGMEQDEFLADVKTQSAVLHQLLVMGEAVKRLSEGLRLNHPQVPWKLMAGMRDVLIHAYDAVDLNQVWQTTQVDVPNVLSQVDPLLPQKPT
jgi:uncharacterized protein with HEPN domain